MKFLIIDIRKRVGDTSTPHYAVRRITEELSSRSIPCELCHYDEISVFTHENELIITAKNTPLAEYSHIIMRGHRTHYEYMLKRFIVDFAEQNRIKVQNAEFIKILPYYNKINQMTILSQAGIPCIDSYYSVDGRYWEKQEALEWIGFPLIYKHTEGEYRIENIDGKDKTKKNVYLIESHEELQKACELRDAPDGTHLTKDSHYFIQKYMDIGEDYRAIMIGGNYLSGWKRVATKNFLTVSKGSEYSLYDKPEPTFIDLAEKASRFLKADYCAVDIIYANDTPCILEVNMNPGFKAFETKLSGSIPDIAKAIADNMLEA